MVNPLLNRASESFTGHLATIGSDHAYVHKGLAFTAIVNTGAISELYKISLKTPTVASGQYIHWRPIGLTSSAAYCKIEIYQGDTFSGGAAVTPINRNRNSSTVTTMQSFAKGTTVTLSGTLLSSTGVGSAGNPTAQRGGGAMADQELLLLPNTSYSHGVTPSGSTTCIFEFFWYEEPRGI